MLTDLLSVTDAHQDRHSPTFFDDSESEESFRIFVALFDYDPSSMSPNPDAADEELPFKEGQIIKVCVCVYLKGLLALVPWWPALVLPLSHPGFWGQRHGRLLQRRAEGPDGPDPL